MSAYSRTDRTDRFATLRRLLTPSHGGRNFGNTELEAPMRKTLAAAALLSALSWGSALAQTPPMSEPKPAPHGNMMGDGMGKMDAGCPMMKKMAAMEDRLKKLEQRAPQQQ